MAPLKVEVTGSCRLPRTAEVAILHLEAHSQNDTQELALSAVLNAVTQINELLDRLSPKDQSGRPVESATVSSWSHSTLTTGIQRFFGRTSDSQPSYSVSTTYEVTFREVGKLSSVVSMLSSMDNVQINRIEWKLTEETMETLLTSSRHGAISNAMKKAQDYASAIGVKELHVTHVKDIPPPKPLAGLFNSYSNPQAFGGGGGVSEEPDWGFRPQNMMIESEVLMTLEGHHVLVSR